jgi:hypothetical protein
MLNEDIMTGGKPVAALLRAKVDAADQISITKITTLKEGYMLITDFENCMGNMTVKIYPSEAAARASSPNERVLKVKVEREL